MYLKEFDNILVVNTNYSPESIEPINNFLQKCKFTTVQPQCKYLYYNRCDMDTLLWIKDVAYLRQNYSVMKILLDYDIDALVYTKAKGNKRDVFLTFSPNNTFEILCLLIMYAVMKYPETIVWVAIPPEISVFKKIVEYLSTNGFDSPQISSKPLVNEYLPNPVFSMVLDKNNFMYDNHEALYKAMIIRNEYLSSLKICTMMVIIPNKVVNKLKEYLDEKFENAGKFIVTSYAHKYVNDKYVPTATLGILENSVIQGGVESVRLPYGAFNFHTHPYASMGKGLVGWPSSMDIACVFSDTQLGTIVHFVVSVEGIYSIQLAPLFSRYIELLRKTQGETFIKCIPGLMTNLSMYLQTFNDQSQKVDRFDIISESLEEYLKAINNVTIGNLLDGIDGTCNWDISNSTDYFDKNAFIISHMYWGEMELSEGFSVESKRLLNTGDKCITGLINDFGP